MNQTEKAERFAELHVRGAPLLLYNAWDAGSAKSIAAVPVIAVEPPGSGKNGRRGSRAGDQGEKAW